MTEPYTMHPGHTHALGCCFNGTPVLECSCGLPNKSLGHVPDAREAGGTAISPVSESVIRITPIEENP